jgi:hypothetical protein
MLKVQTLHIMACPSVSTMCVLLQPLWPRGRGQFQGTGTSFEVLCTQFALRCRCAPADVTADIITFNKHGIGFGFDVELDLRWPRGLDFGIDFDVNFGFDFGIDCGPLASAANYRPTRNRRRGRTTNGGTKALPSRTRRRPR